MKEFKKLLIEYKSIIDLGYEISSSKDYTPDAMSYDIQGFIDLYYGDFQYESFEEKKEEIKKYLPQLKEAVKHARKYKKWLTSEYNYTFG